jgi:hypothetical protein
MITTITQENGKWVIETGDIREGGLRTVFANEKAAAEMIALFHQEVWKLRQQQVHCDACGGTWLNDGINAGCSCQEINRLRERLEQYEPKPGHCEHGIEDGEYCEPCNREYKRAAQAANGDEQ